MKPFVKRSKNEAADAEAITEAAQRPTMHFVAVKTEARQAQGKIDWLERELRTRARENEETARLMTIPGIGPVTAMALQAFAPPMESFRRVRDFSAWLGLVPRQHTTGGKPRLGGISKMGQRDLRRLLISGAMAVVGNAVRCDRNTDP